MSVFCKSPLFVRTLVIILCTVYINVSLPGRLEPGWGRGDSAGQFYMLPLSSLIPNEREVARYNIFVKYRPLKTNNLFVISKIWLYPGTKYSKYYNFRGFFEKDFGAESGARGTWNMARDNFTCCPYPRLLETREKLPDIIFSWNIALVKTNDLFVLRKTWLYSGTKYSKYYNFWVFLEKIFPGD